MFRLLYLSFWFIFIATRPFLHIQQIRADFGCPKSNLILGVYLSWFYCRRQFDCPTVFLPLSRGMLLNKLSLVKSLSWRSWSPLQPMRRCHGSTAGSLGKSQNTVSSSGQETMENFCECFFSVVLLFGTGVTIQFPWMNLKWEYVLKGGSFTVREPSPAWYTT